MLKISTDEDIKDGEFIITCVGPRYLDKDDEESFYEWVEKISCIRKVTASGPELFFHIPAHKMTHDDLGSLLALFSRYKLPNMKQFQQFVTDKSGKQIYGDKQSYWYKKVFDVSH